jgi:hypothetical protein
MTASILIRCIAALICSSFLNAEEETAADRLLDKVVQQEHAFVQELRNRTPIVETYIQETASSGVKQSARDHYFLGRMSFKPDLMYVSIAERSSAAKPSRLSVLRSNRVLFVPSGFAQMVMPDADHFDRKTYEFEFVRREFLGEVRTIVFNVKPRDSHTEGLFIGRIWVEDRDLNIVRFNGTYSRPNSRRVFFDFDSWRINTAGGRWIPSCIYIEESNTSNDSKAPRVLSFKGQTRLWGYNSSSGARMSELTTILAETDTRIEDKEAVPDASPLESQRSWERQSEENILDRLESSGLIAPKGPADAVLNAVVANLSAGSKLSVDAQVRVLMTTPLESFTVGHTIVISRGLVDVLPDEASLAMLLAGELAHVALGHRTNTRFAFTNQMMFSDEQLLQKFRFSRTPEEVAEAGKKAIELLSNSPYSGKLDNAGLFLKALTSKASTFPNLIRPNIGNQLADGDKVITLATVATEAPALDQEKLEQIAALPLGSRIKIDPWTNALSLLKLRPLSLLSAREKMSFEVTPFMVYLTKSEAPSGGGQ